MSELSEMIRNEFPFSKKEFAEKHKMTEQQLEFLIEFSNCKKVEKAALHAGYKDSSARRAGQKILAKKNVKAAYDELKSLVLEDKGWGPNTVGKVLSELISVYEKCTQDREVKNRHGDPTGEYKIDATNAIRCLELVGKEKGMFVQRVEVTDFDPAEVVNEAAARVREARKTAGVVH